ncbi:C6 transcription factor [Penicillium macrosclerotiorum]|uniref:C6 transcription factor n=1 Tax=Penicillium macrosclerotiorum TaxID=303699 RepID=UPI0025490253|nr:C6 transcription factor [Penicillium macrosclerotiorum]KAJ5689730.1 C6 transcription factor [Penicillium macrosclerotiorum]
MKDRTVLARRSPRGMVRKPGVLSTFPMDNLLAEVHRLLGPTWTLPPYNHLLPPYLNQPSNLQREDLDFLIRKGALDLPELGFAHEIFRAYIRHIHPHIPFLDLDLFSPIFKHGRPKTQQVSLLLYQAVMFAGAIFVDLKYLYAAGYLSRRHALGTLFQRVRLLYDFEAEDDKMVIIQALLLMTYWYENPDRHKDGRHWITVCISLACKIGLHLDYAQPDVPHPKFRNLLWWSIFTRDRLIALGLQQPPVIKDEVWLPIPTLTVNDLAIVHEEYAAHCYGSYERSLALIFVEKIKLCRCIKDNLFSWGCRPLHAPVAGKPRRASLWLTKLEVDDWVQDLPSNIAFSPNSFLPPTNADLIFHSHCAWLKMVSLEIYSTLHRQLDFLSEQYSPRQPLSDGPGGCPVLRAAVDVTAILQDLYHKHLIYYLPTTSVAMILRAGIIHIQDMFSHDTNVGRVSFRRLVQCILALQQLGRRYGSAFLLASVLGAPKGHGSSVTTCSPEEILAHLDIECLDRLTLGDVESSESTILKIREPYDVDIISGLKSRKEKEEGSKKSGQVEIGSPRSSSTEEVRFSSEYCLVD